MSEYMSLGLLFFILLLYIRMKCAERKGTGINHSITLLQYEIDKQLKKGKKK
jgi:hypothetical protein